MSWESTLQSWSTGPSQTESQKCENAESVIKGILRNDSDIADLNIRVFVQGSYRARTNVRLDSDVDICVCLNDTFFYDLPSGSPQNPQDYGIIPASALPTFISYSEFKERIGAALIRALGTSGVKRGNKAFDVHANSYRIDADVVPAFQHRRYLGVDASGVPQYLTGIEFRPDNGGRVINWPEQTYSNGVSKNDRTGRKYKRVIRILKRLRNRMQDLNIQQADNIGSFLIESLVWNAPDGYFLYQDYTRCVREVLAHCFNATMTEQGCSEWGEVNELKYLFRAGQAWSREQAHGFLSAAWDFLELT